jgi:hypothetical protein
LLGVAAIQGIVGLLGWWLYSFQFGPLDWVITFSFVLYIILAVWARWQPLAAAIGGAVLYGAFLVIQGLTSRELLFTGLQFKLPNVALLVFALVAGVLAHWRAPRVCPPSAE